MVSFKLPRNENNEAAWQSDSGKSFLQSKISVKSIRGRNAPLYRCSEGGLAIDCILAQVSKRGKLPCVAKFHCQIIKISWASFRHHP